MASYSVETTLIPTEIIQKARAYFGNGGLGLEVIEQSECCAHFQGGGGFVRVSVGNAGKKTTVNLETREWDNPVKHYMSQIAL